MPNKKTARCDVAMLVDEETGARRVAGDFVPDRNSVESYVLNALRASYQNVVMVPFSRDIARTLSELRALRPRIVFNLTEWVAGDRALDAAIAGLLDLLKLRYTGSGPEGMRLARDKALSKNIVSALGVAVPRHFVLERGSRVINPGLAYPLIVKPQFGDGSDEVRGNSLVKSEREFRSRVRVLRRRVREPLICEEFIAGSDLYVALLGNVPQVMHPVELVIRGKGAAVPTMATFRLKNDGAYRTKWRIRWLPAKLGAAALKNIARASRGIFRALKLRDYARIDYRLTPDGHLVFLEANANPDLHPHAMGINRCFVGVQHAEVIRRIVEAARRRSGSE
jgi:D-alanine-D-alanine ligase